MTTLPMRPAIVSGALLERIRTGIGSRFGRQVLVFGAIGIVSTGAYGVLFLALRGPLGPIAANAAALILTAIGNTAANRRLTFGVRGRDGGPASMVRDQLGGFLALAVALAITTATANLLAAFAPNAGRLVELAALTVANAAATVARFALLRGWIAGRADQAQSAKHPQGAAS